MALFRMIGAGSPKFMNGTLTGIFSVATWAVAASGSSAYPDRQTANYTGQSFSFKFVDGVVTAAKFASPSGNLQIALGGTAQWMQRLVYGTLSVTFTPSETAYRAATLSNKVVDESFTEYFIISGENGEFVKVDLEGYENKLKEIEALTYKDPS